MNILRGDLQVTNAIFVACTAPILIRIWVEAVHWRMELGPQMLGFSLMHGGAGVLTIPLLLSLFLVQLYFLWALILAARTVVPSWRRSATGAWRPVAGALAVFIYIAVADTMQDDISEPSLYAGATAMTFLVMLLVGASIAKSPGHLRSL